MANEPDRCPECHEPNHCAVAAADPHRRCWCMDESFPSATQPAAEAIKASTGATACLCRVCVQRLKSG